MLRLFVILICLFFGCALLYGQERTDTLIELKGVEVHAQQLFQKEQAGMKKSTVDSTILARKINLSLSQVLSENTAVFIKNHGRGALSTASFRGTAPSHTQLLWNGININSPMTGMVDFSVIPMFVADKIDLSHGSSSLRHGSGGLGGSISMNNQAHWKQGLGLEYIQGLGSFETYEQYASLSLGIENIQIKTRAYLNQSANNYTFINRSIVENINEQPTHPLDTHRNANYLNYGVLQEVYLRAASNQTLSARWWSHWSDRSIPRATSYEGPDYSNLNKQWDVDHRFSADWNYYLPEGKIKVLMAGADKSLEYSQKNHVGGRGLIPIVISQSTQRTYYQKFLAQNTLSENWSWETSISHKSDAVFSTDSVLQNSFEGQRNDFSVMLNVRGNLWETINLNMMLRQNLTDDVFSPMMPFIGMDIKPFENTPLLWKSSLARNYHYPTLNDLHWQPGGNPDLKPEQAMSYETGLQYRYHSDVLFDAELSYFYSDVENWIIWIPSIKGYWEPRNIRKVISKGAEASLSMHGNLGNLGFKTLVNYSYTRAENYGDPWVWGDASYGKQLVYIPIHSGNAFFQLEYHRWRLYWQHNSYSERFTTSSNEISRRDWLYPYFMNDLGLSRDFGWRRIEGSAEIKIYNVFDEAYHSILYRPMPGRSFMILLKVGF